jgi:hypothetical protein
MTELFELYELRPPYYCLSTTLNVWVLTKVNEYGIAELRNAENDEVFWAPTTAISFLELK